MKTLLAILLLASPAFAQRETFPGAGGPLPDRIDGILWGDGSQTNLQKIRKTNPAEAERIEGHFGVGPRKAAPIRESLKDFWYAIHDRAKCSDRECDL